MITNTMQVYVSCSEKLFVVMFVLAVMFSLTFGVLFYILVRC